MYADGVSSKYLEVLLVVYVNLNGCRLAQPGCRVLPGWAVRLLCLWLGGFVPAAARGRSRRGAARRGLLRVDGSVTLCIHSNTEWDLPTNAYESH